MRHPFTIDTDGQGVTVSVPDGFSSLTVDEAQSLIDDLGDAIDAARSWVAHDPFHKDETNEVEDLR